MEKKLMMMSVYLSGYEDVRDALKKKKKKKKRYLD